LKDNAYVPILKGKGGEYLGLRVLDDKTKDLITPLLEVIPVPFDYEKGVPKKTLDAHCEKIAKDIFKARETRPLFVDSPWLDPILKLSGGVHPFAGLFNDFRSRSMMATPVTALSRDADYQSAVKLIVAADGRGVCIRLEAKDFGDAATLEKNLNNVVSQLGLKRRDVDLLLDLRDQPSAVMAKAMIASLADPKQWRTLIVAGTAIPETAANLTKHVFHEIPRTEWSVHKALRKDKTIRPVVFGDYAVNHPGLSELDPRIIKPTAKIKYTTDDNYLFLVGKVYRTDTQQYRKMAKDLVKRPEFTHISWGDDYAMKASKSTPPAAVGSLQTWIQVGTSRHLTFVAPQVASLP
jgi:hypothetical protein